MDSRMEMTRDTCKRVYIIAILPDNKSFLLIVCTYSFLTKMFNSGNVCYRTKSFFYTVREAAKKVIFLVAGPLRGDGG